MNKIVATLCVLILTACTSRTDTQMYGKWYTYTESGDYMELWLGDDKAITYLSAIDELLLYNLERENSLMSFSLVESRRFDEHEFSLDVQQANDKMFQSIFVGGPSIDSLKTYFLVDASKIEVKSSIAENQYLVDELFQRLENGSHAGHGH
ncbi:MAG: hypothetical protein AB8B73_08375 [Ekhidna sp.]